MSDEQQQAFESWWTNHGYKFMSPIGWQSAKVEWDVAWQAAAQATNAAMREALMEARIKIESRAISWEENEQPTLAAEYYRVLDKIDAALANAGQGR